MKARRLIQSANADGPQMARAVFLSDRQFADYPFVNGVGYADASITALINSSGRPRTITPRSFSKSRVTVCREKPVKSATSPTVYAGFKVMREIVLARMGEGPEGPPGCHD